MIIENMISNCETSLNEYRKYSSELVPSSCNNVKENAANKIDNLFCQIIEILKEINEQQARSKKKMNENKKFMHNGRMTDADNIADCIIEDQQREKEFYGCKKAVTLYNEKEELKKELAERLEKETKNKDDKIVIDALPGRIQELNNEINELVEQAKKEYESKN